MLAALVLPLLPLSPLALRDVLAGPNAAPPPEQAVYGVLPMRFLAGAPDSVERLLASVRADLRARGAAFAPEQQLARALRDHRIRHTESVSREDARTLGRVTGVRFLVTGTLLDYAAGTEPRLALSLHLVETTEGRRALSSLVSLRGADFSGLLGLGAITDIDELALEVAARILDEFDVHGWPSAPAEEALECYRPSDALASFQHADFDPTGTERVAVLPLVNRTNRRESGRIFADLLGHHWFRSAGVDVVESSELRATMVRLGVRSLDYLDDSMYARIGAELGARYFVLGSLDRYSSGVLRDGVLSPEVEASSRLLDVREARIVAAATVRRRGEDYHVVLGLGSVDDLTTLADRTAREMVALMGAEE